MPIHSHPTIPFLTVAIALGVSTLIGGCDRPRQKLAALNDAEPLSTARSISTQSNSVVEPATYSPTLYTPNLGLRNSSGPAVVPRRAKGCALCQAWSNSYATLLGWLGAQNSPTEAIAANRAGGWLWIDSTSFSGGRALTGLIAKPGVRRVSFISVPIRDTDFARVKFGEIEELQLVGCGISGSGLGELSKTSMERLQLIESDLTQEGLKELELLDRLRSIELIAPRLRAEQLPNFGRLDKLRALSIRTERTATPSDGEFLSGATKLESLILERVFLNDQALQRIAEMRNLKELVIDGASISDDGLVALSELTNLEHLTLANCPQLTDRGLASLKSLRALRSLNLTNTGVRGTGVLELSGLELMKQVCFDKSQFKVPNSTLETFHARLPQCAVLVDGVDIVPLLSMDGATIGSRPL